MDFFVAEPLPFLELWQRAEPIAYRRSFARVASISDLVVLKRAAGRPQDLEDIERLEQISNQRPDEPQ